MSPFSRRPYGAVDTVAEDARGDTTRAIYRFLTIEDPTIADYEEVIAVAEAELAKGYNLSDEGDRLLYNTTQSIKRQLVSLREQSGAGGQAQV